MKYYFSIFIRRFHWFLIVATVISALSVIVAASLPPSYVSTVRLIFERAQIPSDLAQSTVQSSPDEQMQLMEQRLMTRANLLDIARKFKVVPDLDRMTPDEIVSMMRSRTRIGRGGRGVPMMTISFEAPSARIAAEVVGEYLRIAQQENADFRAARSSGTQEFFQQEVDRLSSELAQQSGRILEFKQQNASALPDGQAFRMSRQSSLEERRAQTEREIAALREQRDRMVQIFQETGRIEGDQQNLSPAEKQLQGLRRELDNALLVYSAGNPRVRVLQARIAQLEATVNAQLAAGAQGEQISPLDVRLAEMAAREEVLAGQLATVEKELATLSEAIAQSPENAIALDGLERDYRNIQQQYNQAVQRLATASTGERIELLARGQRITVLEQPTMPNRPNKPNRILIAGGGSAAGIGAGLALVVLLELLNRTARRPVDLVNKLGISPIATIPYIRTQGEAMRRRSLRIALALAILIGVPAAVYAVHLYYQPLDLLAEKVMIQLGVRW